jgi:hypothetical protein
MRNVLEFSQRNISVVFRTQRYLTCLKILRHGADGLTYPPKEGVPRIFIALKNPSSSAGYEPTNLGSKDKHAKHYTTEDDCVLINLPAVNSTTLSGGGSRLY